MCKSTLYNLLSLLVPFAILNVSYFVYLDENSVKKGGSELGSED